MLPIGRFSVDIMGVASGGSRYNVFFLYWKMRLRYEDRVEVLGSLQESGKQNIPPGSG